MLYIKRKQEEKYFRFIPSHEETIRKKALYKEIFAI